jgi:hypothetical protein
MLYLVVATTILTLFLYQKATLILGPKPTPRKEGFPNGTTMPRN